MSKQSGLGDNFYLAGYDLSGDTAALGAIGGGPAPLDVTGIDKEAYERIGGRRDGRIEWTSHFNDALLAQHPALKTLPLPARVLTYFRGTVLGTQAAGMVGRQVNYDPTRAADGGLSMAVQALSDGFGLEWGRQLTAGKRTDTTDTDGASIQHAAGATNFGLQAYLQVFALTGNDATITIEDSDDDSAFTAVTGGAFTEVTAAPTAERIATAGDLTVDEYLRVATSGDFSSLTFAVVVVRNLTAPVF